MSAEAAADGMRMAGDAADLLLGNRPGLLLIGPERQTQAVVRLVLDRLASWPIIPILFAAPGASRVALRDAVGQAHATRSDPKASLLLVIEEADLLSPALLSELEQAAGAAAEYGGLQFLLAGQQDLAPTLQRDGRAALSKCLRTRLSVRATLPVEARGAAPVGVIVPERRDVVTATASRPGPRIMQAGAILTGCVVVAGLAAAGYLHEHPARPIAQEMLSTPQALIRSPDHPPAQVAQLADPPLPSAGGAASSLQAPSMPPATPTPPASPEPSSPQPATHEPATPDAGLAQADKAPPPSLSSPPVQAAPIVQPVPDQPSPTPPPESSVAPAQPAEDHAATTPVLPAVTPPAQTTAPGLPTPGPDASAAPDPMQTGEAAKPVTPPERQTPAAPSTPGTAAAAAPDPEAHPTSPEAAAPQLPDAPIPGPPAGPASQSSASASPPAEPEQPRQAPATRPVDPAQSGTIPAGNASPDLPAPPAAIPVLPQRLPPLRPAGAVDGPPALTGSTAAQPQGLPAPQRQALLLQPVPVLRAPPRPLPQAAPQTPAGASLLLLAGPNDTLRSLYREVYRGVRPPRFESVAALNPAETRPGMRLIFPAPPDGWPAQRRSHR